MKNIKKQVSIWSWIGRIAPMSALVMLGIALITDLNNYTNYLLIIIATIFATIAFVWWWWIIFTVRELFEMLRNAQDRFHEVLEEIKDLKRKK